MPTTFLILKPHENIFSAFEYVYVCESGEYSIL